MCHLKVLCLATGWMVLKKKHKNKILIWLYEMDWQRWKPQPCFVVISDKENVFFHPPFLLFHYFWLTIITLCWCFKWGKWTRVHLKVTVSIYTLHKLPQGCQWLVDTLPVFSLLLKSRETRSQKLKSLLSCGHNKKTFTLFVFYWTKWHIPLNWFYFCCWSSTELKPQPQLVNVVGG